MKPPAKVSNPKCAECGKRYTPTNKRVAPQQLYCSVRCKMAAYWRRRITSGRAA